jgi:hypothetical protein
MAQGTGLFQALGLYDVLHSVWFRALLIVTGLALVVWLVESVELAYRVATRAQWIPAVLAKWASRAPLVELPSSLPPQDAQIQARDCLVENGFECSDALDSAGQDWIADRRPWLLFAKPVAIAGLLIALAAWVVLGNLGWESADWQPAPRETRSIGHGTPYSVRFDGFEMLRGGAGPVTNAQSQVTWLDGNAVIKQDMASAGQPSKMGQLALRQTGFVPDVTLRGWDASGRPLVLRQAGEEGESLGEVEILFPSAEAQPLLLIPSEDLYVALTFRPPCSDGQPELQVDILRSEGSERQTLARLRESDFLSFDGIKLDIDLEYRPILRFDYHPASKLALLALVLALAAFAVAWLLPPRLVWITTELSDGGSTVVSVRSLAGPGLDAWMPDLVDRLQQAVTDVS